MHGAGREVFCAGFFEESEQGVGVEFFGFPKGDKIGVSKFGRMPIGFDVVVVIFISFDI